jgi:hypothetical protein
MAKPKGFSPFGIPNGFDMKQILSVSKICTGASNRHMEDWNC